MIAHGLSRLLEQMRQYFRWMMGVCFGLICTGILSGVNPAQASELQAIAQVRQNPPTTVVTIQGQVTVPSGAFASGTGDPGFAIQDATAGIYVSTAEDWGVVLEQVVQITGAVHDDGHGLLVLEPTSQRSLQPIAQTIHITPHSVETGAVGENTEGELVILKGAIAKPLRRDPPYGVGIMLDDGSGPVQVFINQTTEISVPDLVMGQELQVQGFSGQYEQFIEVSPRVASDIEIL